MFEIFVFLFTIISIFFFATFSPAEELKQPLPLSPPLSSPIPRTIPKPNTSVIPKPNTSIVPPVLKRMDEVMLKPILRTSKPENREKKKVSFSDTRIAKIGGKVRVEKAFNRKTKGV